MRVRMRVRTEMALLMVVLTLNLIVGRLPNMGCKTDLLA